MGLTMVNLHIKVNNAEQENRVKEYYAREDSDCLRKQSGYISICSDTIGLENFEDVAEELSQELGLPILAAMVFDSDVVVLQGYIDGRKDTGEIKGYEGKEKMDRRKFMELFASGCTEEQISEVLDKDIYVFAEDIFADMGKLMGMELLAKI